MSHQELNRLEVLKLVKGKRLNQLQAKKQLNISTRQFKIQVRYRKYGAKGILSWFWLNIRT